MMFKPSFFGLLLVGVLAMSCATPPPPVPDTPPPPPPVDTTPPPPPPVDTPPPPPPPPVDVPNDDPLGLNAPFSEAEVAEVEAALAAARQAGADRWAPDLLRQASETFEQAKVLGSTNRAADGRPLLAQALAQANAARDAAFAARLGQARQRLADARQSAVDRRADRWDPQGFARAEETARPVTDLLNAQDVSGSEVAVDRAVAAYAALIRQIEERLGALERLQTSVDLQLAEAESLEAFIWVPELLEGAQDAALRGAVARGRFNLDASEESYNEALFLTGRALREVRVQKARRETEDLMLETMRQIEAASRRMILQDDQTVREGQPWTGEPFLNRPAAPVPTEDRNSQAWPADGVIAVAAETVVVAADDLERAKQLWLQGVLEKDAGNFAQANALFLEAQRFIQMYLAKAVDKFYTVRLIPERRDSLWRIAEYPEIYGTPWDWPRIWRANRRLIENPDLIYPGWQLVIPPR